MAATYAVTVTQTWTYLANGPICIQARNNQIEYAISTNPPAPTDSGFVPDGIQSIYPPTGASIYVRTSEPNGARLIWAAISAPSSGGSTGPSNPGGVLDFSVGDNSALLAALAA